MQLTRFLAASIVAAALALSACSAPEAGTASSGDALDVVVAFYPLQFVTERVGGTEVEITNLTQPGAEAHDVELTPRQIATLAEADVIIYERGFQPAVDTAVERVQPARVLDITTVVDLHPMTGSGDHDHDSEGKHDHSGADPHVWLDPTNMIIISDSVAAVLSGAQPEKTETFRSNATALDGELTALDASFRTGLQTCARREFVVSHAAFGYLADRYQLTQISLRGLSAEEEPSPTRIAEVQELAREHGITTIFYETLVSPEVAESVAGDLSLKTDVLDPLEGLADTARGKNYLEVMNANLTALKAANECR